MPDRPFNSVGERPARDTRLPREFNASGQRRATDVEGTPRLRIRNRWLFGAVVEELIETHDGRTFWRPVAWPQEILGRPR